MTTSTTDSTANQPRPGGDLRIAQDWLDALSSGACSEEAFLRAVREFTRKDPDAGWDLLSLLDQYYRRGKIQPDSFRTLKSALESQLLGTALDIEVSVPLLSVPSAPPVTAQPVPSAPPVTAQPVPSAPPMTAQPVTADSKVPPTLSPPLRGRSVPAATVPAATTLPSAPPAVARSAAPAARGASGGAPREIAVGDVLRGRYRIQSVLGRGGTALVLEAIDQYRLELPHAGQRVAIKMLPPAMTAGAELLIELRREFQNLQSLSHPNIVRVHEYDRDGDVAFFTMEYLSGLSLARILSARHQVALQRSYALAITLSVGAAIAYAHSRGIVHGDLNPGNIFVTDDGEVRVLDFGASHAPHNGVSSAEPETLVETSVATPRYASCQLLEGAPLDVRDDLYALACIVYLLWAGKHAFGEHTALQARTLNLKAARPSGLSGEQWRALRSGLCFDRERRPADVEQWLKPFASPMSGRRLPGLLPLLRVSPQRHAPVKWLALTACTLLMLCVGWWVATRFEPVSRTGSEWGKRLETALASAEISLTQLWQRTRDSVSAPAPVPLSGSGTAPPSVPAGTPNVASQPVTAPAPIAAPSPPANPRPVSAAASAPTGAASKAGPHAAGPVPHTARVAGDEPVTSRHPTTPAPRSRLELAASTIDLPVGEPAAHVVVRRSSNLRGEASFSWWTESGTAKAGQDFVGVGRHEEHIEDGKAAVNLFIPVVAGANRRQPKSFYVVISDPSANATLGARTLTMVTMLPSE